MPAPALTPEQLGRVKAGGCACGCGESIEPQGYYGYTAQRYASPACRQRAHRERQRAGLAIPAQERARARAVRNLELARAELGETERRIKSYTNQVHDLKRLISELEAIVHPAQQLIAPEEPRKGKRTRAASSHPAPAAPVTVELREEGLEEAAWRMCTEPCVLMLREGRYVLTELRDPGPHREIGRTRSDHVEALLAAGLLAMPDGWVARPTSDLRRYAAAGPHSLRVRVGAALHTVSA